MQENAETRNGKYECSSKKKQNVSNDEHYLIPLRRILPHSSFLEQALEEVSYPNRHIIIILPRLENASLGPSVDNSLTLKLQVITYLPAN